MMGIRGSSHIDQERLWEEVLTGGRTIDPHIAACSLCREHLARLREFHEAALRERHAGPSETDRRLARTLLHLPRKQFGVHGLLPETIDAIRVLSGGRSVVSGLRVGILRYPRSHPLITGVGAAVLGLAAMLAFFLFFRTPVRDTNPFIASIRDYRLTVMNRDAVPLWSMALPGYPDYETIDHGQEDGRKYILLGDMDNDGKNEVIIAGIAREGDRRMDSLYCYDGPGQLRWAVNVGPIISFGDTTILQHERSCIMNMTIIPRTRTSGPRLFVLAVDYRFSPAKLVELSPADGHELQAYYNRGASTKLDFRDLYHDGRYELLLGGINDGFNKAYLSILDPDRLNGHAPVPSAYEPAGIGRANEIRYILFPVTDLCRHYGYTPYSDPAILSYDSGGRIIYVLVEKLKKFPLPDLDVEIAYTIDSMGSVVSIAPGNGFIRAVSYLRDHDIESPATRPGYLRSILDSVQYMETAVKSSPNPLAGVGKGSPVRSGG